MNKGFTLIEMIIVIVIMGILTSVLLVNYTKFSSRSSIYSRITEITSILELAKERSSAAEILDVGQEQPTRGYQAVRLIVYDGLLYSITSESKAYSANYTTEFFKTTDNNDLDNKKFFSYTDLGERFRSREAHKNTNFASILTNTENYTIKTCFITKADSGNGVRGYTYFNSNIVEDYDVLFLIEQPTRLIYPYILPMERSYINSRTFSNSPPTTKTARPINSNRIEKYSIINNKQIEGMRVEFSNESGFKKSLDVYLTGLVEPNPNNGDIGCSQASHLI